MKYLYVLFFCLLVYSCNTLSKEKKLELWSMIKSNNVDSILIATIEIQKAKDTSMIDAILYKANDPRISQNAFHKGMSVYQVKMTALEQITGIEPPVKITYKVDTLIINFYKKKVN